MLRSLPIPRHAFRAAPLGIENRAGSPHDAARAATAFASIEARPRLRARPRRLESAAESEAYPSMFSPVADDCRNRHGPCGQCPGTLTQPWSTRISRSGRSTARSLSAPESSAKASAPQAGTQSGQARIDPHPQVSHLCREREALGRSIVSVHPRRRLLLRSLSKARAFQCVERPERSPSAQFTRRREAAAEMEWISDLTQDLRRASGCPSRAFTASRSSRGAGMRDDRDSASVTRSASSRRIPLRAGGDV